MSLQSGISSKTALSIRNTQPMIWARMALVAGIPLAAGGCAHIAGVNESAQRGYAFVTIPRLANGDPTVTVFSVHSKKGVFVSLNIPPHVNEIFSFALRPGEHQLEVACWRPDAVSLIDDLWIFRVVVEENQNYNLDCAPAKVEGQECFENHFSLTQAAPGRQ